MFLKKKKKDIIPRHVGEVFFCCTTFLENNCCPQESVEKLLTESPTEYKISHFYTIDCVS